MYFIIKVLTNVFFQNKNVEGVQNLLKKIFRINLYILSSDQTQTISLFEIFLIVYVKSGDHDRTKHIGQQALFFRVKHFGNLHLTMLGIVQNLVYIYQTQGEFGTTNELYFLIF